jgi:hypothetical protein
MKKFYSAFVLSVFIFCSGLFAQKETQHWYFGTLAGLDFTSGSPVAVSNGMINTTEGCAAISNASGNLLFYTDGISVWNNTHSVMPNGTGLLGDVSTTQSALIVKKPGSTMLFYIFTLPAEGVGNFCYSVVDLSLDGGKGDVTTKNIILKSNVTEKLGAVYHCNGTDIWVLIHEWNNKVFDAFLVSSLGVASPVVSTTGRVHGDVHGQMKFNNTGTKIACVRDTVIQATNPYLGKAFLDILNFNNQTGAVTHSLALTLGSWQKSYGTEFSPDNSKVYATAYDQSGINGGNSEALQFDLSMPNVAASSIMVGSGFDPEILRAIQLAPDGKLYISKSNSPFLCSVSAPNLAGAACNYSDNAVNVDPNSVGAMCMLGLPGFVTSYFNASFPNIVTCQPTNTNTAGFSESKNGNSVLHSVYFSVDRSELTVKGNFDDDHCYDVQLTDVSGKILCSEMLIADGRVLSCMTKQIEPGIYFVMVAGDGRKHTAKFVVN